VTRADDGEIRSLLARLAHLADVGEVDDYLALFTPDAVWVMPVIPQSGLEASERRGVTEIAAGVRERRASGVQGPGTDTAHVVTTTAIAFDGADPDTAIAESIWMFVADTASGAPRLQGFGRYRDTVKRTGGAWRLARREIALG
jgi:3-phenylpropionate/cinnamic acid dioxygenase small subunit